MANSQLAQACKQKLDIDMSHSTTYFGFIPEKLILAKKEASAVDHLVASNQTHSPTWRRAGIPVPFPLLQILLSSPLPSIAWLRDCFALAGLWEDLKGCDFPNWAPHPLWSQLSITLKLFGSWMFQVTSRYKLRDAWCCRLNCVPQKGYVEVITARSA